MERGGKGKHRETNGTSENGFRHSPADQRYSDTRTTNNNGYNLLLTFFKSFSCMSCIASQAVRKPSENSFRHSSANQGWPNICNQCDWAFSRQTNNVPTNDIQTLEQPTMANVLLIFSLSFMSCIASQAVKKTFWEHSWANQGLPNKCNQCDFSR